jgi:hypothetical protein
MGAMVLKTILLGLVELAETHPDAVHKAADIVIAAVVRHVEGSATTKAATPAS